MNKLDERSEIIPGRYQSIGDGMFRTRCKGCEVSIDLSWGRAGPGSAPLYLRRAGWSVLGATNGARWRCPSCSRDAARKDLSR